MSGGALEAEVTALGFEGDGRVETPSGTVYVPYTVPGDRVLIPEGGRRPAEAVRVADGPDRIQPACRHFGTCGGCVLQHVGPAAYAAWKRARVERALAAEGLEAEVVEPFVVAPGSRRRIRLAAQAGRRGGGPAVLGFRARRSHRLVAVESCPIAEPALVALLPPLAAALGRCLAGHGEVTLTVLDGEIDVAVEAGGPPGLAASTALAELAEAQDLARVTWSGAPVLTRRQVALAVGGFRVELPPGAFVQPTAAGEARLQALAAEALAGARRIADLYAGAGALGLALAGRVTLYEADAAASGAVASAIARAGQTGRVRAERRDLRRRPLERGELEQFDGVVLDPPRAGAREQALRLAASSVPAIAYASCNPVTFARDARILADGGYALGRVEPIDQFLWSPHVELIGTFRR